MPDPSALRVHPAVTAALEAGRPVVALESTLLAHGLPRPANARVAREVEDAVRAEGAVPATVAVLDGVARVGLDADGLQAVTGRDDVVKAGVRDLAVVVARGGNAATTVASTAYLARLAGVRVFATGGLGGVHREARTTWDESADLTTLARTGMVVVCAGVKSVLDVPATLERLETLNVGVLGYGTDRFPGFYLRDSGYAVTWRVDEPAEVAAVMYARDRLGLADSALLVANPLPADEQLDPDLHDTVLTSGLRAAGEAGVHGKDVTPFLLDHFHRETSGASLEVNIRIVRRNATLAARIAAAAVAGAT
ncbi:MAG: pseudouridine-5'-phosphate glycosidase [Actinomycetes bacterium]